MERQVRGDVLIAHFGFVKRKWGADGVNKVIADAGFDPTNLNPKDWYPDTYDLDYLRSIERHSGTGDGHIAFQSGFHAATHLGLLGYIARIMPIKALLSRSLSHYKDAFTYGELHIVELEEEYAILRFVNLGPEQLVCHSWTGAFEGLLKISGNKGTVEHTACRHHGDEFDDFKMSW